MSNTNTTYFNGLPLYEAVINGESDGIFCVSFVSEPATQKTWQLFSSHKRRLLFNDDKMEVTGVLMLADTPIYRVDNETNAEFYIYYKAETLKQMVAKMLKDNTFNNIDTQHDGKTLPKGAVSMTAVYQLDDNTSAPVPQGIPAGSVICSYKIHDTALWDKMKSGELTGFSLAGYFTLVETNNTDDTRFINNLNFKNMKKKVNSIKALLSRLVLNFEETALADGTLWLHDGELKEGAAVTLEDGTPVPDGSYETDTLTITVTEGVVSSVSQKDTEDREPVEADEETPADPSADAIQAQIDEMKSDIEGIKADIDAIKSVLAAKEDTPVVEEFTKAATNRNMSRASRFIAAL